MADRRFPRPVLLPDTHGSQWHVVDDSRLGFRSLGPVATAVARLARGRVSESSGRASREAWVVHCGSRWNACPAVAWSLINPLARTPSESSCSESQWERAFSLSSLSGRSHRQAQARKRSTALAAVRACRVLDLRNDPEGRGECIPIMIQAAQIPRLISTWIMGK